MRLWPRARRLQTRGLRELCGICPTRSRTISGACVQQRYRRRPQVCWTTNIEHRGLARDWGLEVLPIVYINTSRTHGCGMHTKVADAVNLVDGEWQTALCRNRFYEQRWRCWRVRRQRRCQPQLHPIPRTRKRQLKQTMLDLRTTALQFFWTFCPSILDWRGAVCD